jgi:hypothetical protein
MFLLQPLEALTRALGLNGCSETVEKVLTAISDAAKQRVGIAVFPKTFRRVSAPPSGA